MSRQYDRASRAAAQWRTELPGLPVEAMELLGRLNEVSARIRREVIEPTLANHGLTGAEFDVLATLRRAGAPHTLTPTALYEATMLSSGGMTARLDGLERRGLIIRSANPDDRRGVLVSLTDTGRALTEAAVTDHAANEERFVGALDGTDRISLARILSEMLETLDKQKDKAR